MAKSKRNSKSSATEANSKESTYPPIDPAQKEWLVRQFSEEFDGRVGKQGKIKNSAMEYVREVIIQQFYDLWYPNSTPGQQEEMSAYYEDKIYHALNNRRRRGKGNSRQQGGRVLVTSVWMNANPDIKAKLLSDYREKEGMESTARIGVDIQRKLICDAFRALPEDEKQKWEDAADEARAANSKHKALQGEERLLFSQRFPTLLSQFILDAQEKAGVLVVAHVAYEISDVGAMQVASVVSPNVKAYKSTDPHADSVAAWTEWLRDSEAKNVKRDHPVEATYPDRQNENYPLIPEIDEEHLPPLPVIRKIVRVATGAIWQRLGGSHSPPWKEISRSQAKGEHVFVDECRQPPDHPLIDPSIMNKEYGMVWVHWLARTQRRLGDPSTWFCFKVVFTNSSTLKTVRSDAIKRTKIQKGSSEVWRLEYDGWVEQCQIGGHIRYPQESLEYEEALKRRAGALSRAGSSHLLGLPCQRNYEATQVIDSETRAHITSIVEKLPPEEKEGITRVVDALNEMYMLLPAETKDGIWCQGGQSLLSLVGLPAALPSSNSSLPTPLAFLKSPLPVEYFLPPSKASTTGRFIFLEEWQERVLQEGFLRHPESKTLLGGKCGTLWPVLVLLKALLNVGFVIGKVDLGVPLPAEVDKRRFSGGDWEMMLDWCKEWRTAIEATVTILKETFDERTREGDGHCANTQTSGSKLESQPLESSRSQPGSPSTSQHPLPRPRPRPRPRPVTYALERLPGVDDDCSSAGTDSDEEASDNFKPSGGDSDDGDTEDEEERSGGGGSGPNGKKGKGIAPGERGVVSDPWVPKIAALRERYEDSHGVKGSEPLQNPVDNVQLKSHPFGTILTPNRSEPWEGELKELPSACAVVVQEASAALKAMYQSSNKSYSPHDKLQAQQDAECADTSPSHRPHLAVIYRQRIVWNRAKDLWPTIQYQLRLFAELIIKLANFVLILDSSMSSASGELADDLKKYLRRATRIAYRVRFVYQELNDLGVVSKEYYGRMTKGWEGSWCPSSLSELKDNIGIVLEWSEKAAAVSKYHEESRRRTWEHHRDVTKGRAVPEAVWYMFGNPSPLEDAVDIRAWLQEGTRVSDDTSGPIETSAVRGMSDSHYPMEIFLNAATNSIEPMEVVAVEAKAGGVAPADEGDFVAADKVTAAQPSISATPKRRSNPPEGNQRSGASSKKPKMVVEVEFKGKDKGAGRSKGPGATTRAGRIVKVSERARNQG